MKLAFIDIGLYAGFFQFLKNFTNMTFVFFEIIVINQNIIKINHYEIVQIIHQCVVHEILKCEELVCQFEKQYSVFVRPESSSKRDQIFVFFDGHFNAIKSMSNVNFGQIFRF